MGQPGAGRELDAVDRVAFGGEAPQGGVDESGRPRLADGPGQLHRGVDRGVRRHPGESDLVEPEEGEDADVGVAGRAGRDQGQPGFQARQVAQGSERELPGEGPLARVEPRVEPGAPGRAE